VLCNHAADAHESDNAVSDVILLLALAFTTLIYMCSIAELNLDCYVALAVECIAAAVTAHHSLKVAAFYQCLLFLDNVHCCAIAQEHFSSVGEVERADVVMESRSSSRPATATATATAADTGTTSTASDSQATAADTTAKTVAVVPAEQQQQHQPKSKGYGIVRFATIEAAQASHSTLTI
jgi:hypothetical protein